MKKLIMCLSVFTTVGLSIKLATASEPTTPVTTTKTATTATTAKDLVAKTYAQIDFSCGEKISFEAFEKGLTGYLNLKNAGKLNDQKQVLTIADFSLSSTKRRLWVIDMESKKVLLNDYVAHGQGSGLEFATNFSNTENSHQSSLGFYVTSDTYVGKHGNSLRLNGMDKGFNSAALERAVVVHGADYVSADFVSGQKRLGRSWGCPAVSNQVIGKVINWIKGGTCLFVYAPQKAYLASSQWLRNTPVDMINTPTEPNPTQSISVN